MYKRRVLYALLVVSAFLTMPFGHLHAQTSTTGTSVIRQGVTNYPPIPAALMPGVTFPKVGWGFQAESIKNSVTNDEAAVRFSWNQPEIEPQTVTVPDTQGPTTTNLVYPNIEYRIQYISVTNYKQKFGNSMTTAGCNDRGSAWLEFPNSSSAKFEGTHEGSGDNPYHVTVDGAREPQSYYRLVLHVFDVPLKFTNIPNSYPTSKPHEYILSCTQSPFDRVHTIAQGQYSVHVTSTLNGNAVVATVKLVKINPDKTEKELTSSQAVGKRTTPTTIVVSQAESAPVNGEAPTFRIVVSYLNQKYSAGLDNMQIGVTRNVPVKFTTDGSPPTADQQDITDNSRTVSGNADDGSAECSEYLGFKGITFQFQPAKYIGCQLGNLLVFLNSKMADLTAYVPI